MLTDEQRAASLIRQYTDAMVSVIIRHGDINNDKSFSLQPGEAGVLHKLKSGDVVADVTDITVKPYSAILRAEWARANYRHGDPLRQLQDMDPDLKETDPATIIEIDLNSVRYQPRALTLA